MRKLLLTVRKTIYIHPKKLDFRVGSREQEISKLIEENLPCLQLVSLGCHGNLKTYDARIAFLAYFQFTFKSFPRGSLDIDSYPSSPPEMRTISLMKANDLWGYFCDAVLELEVPKVVGKHTFDYRTDYDVETTSDRRS